MNSDKYIVDDELDIYILDTNDDGTPDIITFTEVIRHLEDLFSDLGKSNSFEKLAPLYEWDDDPNDVDGVARTYIFIHIMILQGVKAMHKRLHKQHLLHQLEKAEMIGDDSTQERLIREYLSQLGYTGNIYNLKVVKQFLKILDADEDETE